MTNTALQGFDEVVDLMNRIKASGNDWPKVRLDFDGEPLQLKLSGHKARVPGAIALTNGLSYHDKVNQLFYGDISPSGAFSPAAAARRLPQEKKKALWSLLTRLKGGQAEAVFAEYGKKFGTCCLCGRELTNAESVELGIGPICRERAFG